MTEAQAQSEDKADKDQDTDSIDASILIVDRDTSFLEKIRPLPNVTPVQPLPCAKLEAARDAICDPNRTLVGAFLSSELDNLEWISLIETIQKKRPGLPIYVFEGSTMEIEIDQLAGLGVKRTEKKPIDFKEIVEEIAPLALKFDVQSALDRAKKNSDVVGEVSQSDRGEFVAIRADNFLSGSDSIFDVYIRLGEGKFIKVLHAGEAFDPDRLTRYLEKGVTHFHIKKNVQDLYLNYCKHITEHILKSKKISMDVKVAQTLNVGQETLNYFKNNGVDKNGIEHAENYASAVTELFGQFDPKKMDMLAGFMSDVASYEHGVSTVMVSSLLAKTLNMESHQTLHVLSMSSLLHDVGLLDMPAEVQTEDESKMSKEQIEIYRKHPQIGADRLSKAKDIPQSVSQAIALHHVRRNRLGFPNHISATHRNIVSEIVGISDEFSKLIERTKTDPKFNPILHMKTHIYRGFTKEIVMAFEATFAHKPVSTISTGVD